MKNLIIKKYFFQYFRCLLYTSDAADERSSVDLGGRRIIKKKNTVELAARLIIDKKESRSSKKIN